MLFPTLRAVVAKNITLGIHRIVEKPKNLWKPLCYCTTHKHTHAGPYLYIIAVYLDK